MRLIGIAVRVNKHDVFADPLLKVCRVGDVNVFRALGDRDGVGLLLAGMVIYVIIAHFDRARSDIIKILRAVRVERDGGEVVIRIVFVRIECFLYHDLRRGGSKARVLAALRIAAEQIVGARLVKGVGEFAAVVVRRNGLTDLLPLRVIHLHIKAGDRVELFRAAVGHRFGVVLNGVERQGLAGSDGIIVLVKRGERAAVVPEAPVGEQGNVNRVAVREEDVVARRAPARAHQRIDVVAVVHEVFVMTPELLHVQRRGAAGDVERSHVVRIRDILVHIVHICGTALVAVDLHFAGHNLFRLVAEIVHADHVKIQLQRRRPLNDHVVHILALAVVGVITVKVRKTLVCQIEVRDVHLEMREDRAVVAHERHAVARDRHIHLDGRGFRFVVAILARIALLALLDGDRELYAGGFAAGARRRDGQGVVAHFGFREREIPAPVLVLGDLGLRAVFAAERIGQRVTFAVGEIVGKLDLELCALLCREGRFVFRYFRRCEASVRCERRYRQQREHHQQREKQSKALLTHLHKIFPFLS